MAREYQRCAHKRHFKIATFKRIIYRQKGKVSKTYPPPPSLRKDINFVHPKTRARFTDFCCCGNKFTDGCRKHLFDTIPNNLPAIKKTFHQGCTGQGILLTCWAKSCGAGQGKCTHRADNFRLLWGRAPCFFFAVWGGMGQHLSTTGQPTSTI